MIPEFAARLERAYGSMFQGIDGDDELRSSRAARMIKQGVIAGLPSAGIHVVDLSQVPVPVARYETRTLQTVGERARARLADDHRMVDIKIFDGHGLNIDKNTERKVETTFFQEDFRRVPMADIGAIEVVSDPARRYRDAFLEHVDARTINGARARIVVDYGLGTTSTILPQLLRAARHRDDQRQRRRRRPTRLRSPAQHEHDLRQLATICRATGASLGALMDNDEKTIALIDDRGTIPPMSALAAFAILAWRVHQAAPSPCRSQRRR